MSSVPPEWPLPLRRHLREAAWSGRLPLLADERGHSLLDTLRRGLRYAVAPWSLWLGSSLAFYVDAKHGALVLFVGCLLGVALGSAPAAVACRYGLDPVDACRATLGQRGAQPLVLATLLSQIGWTGVVLMLFGRGGAHLLGALGLGPSALAASTLSLIGLVAIYSLVRLETELPRLLYKIAIPGLVLIAGLIGNSFLAHDAWLKLWLQSPFGHFNEPNLPKLLAIECALGYGLAFLPGRMRIVRHAQNERAALYASLATWGLVAAAAATLGLWEGLLYQSLDATLWLTTLGGRFFGATALAVFAAGTLGVGTTLMRNCRLTLHHLRSLRRQPQTTLTGWIFVPLGLVLLLPHILFRHANLFVALHAGFGAPLATVLSLDLWAMRRLRLDVGQLFEADPKGLYYYQGGCNWCAWLSILAGFAVWLVAVQPKACALRAKLGPWGASLPACCLTALLYGLLTWLWLWPRRLGGYNSPTQPPHALRLPDV